jgi:hypothetical protein
MQASTAIYSRGVTLSCKPENNALSRLIFDGQSTVFTTDCRDVYAWSVGEDSEQLLIEASVVGSEVNNPIGIVGVDRQRNLLYTARFDRGVISVFNLTYT